MQVSRGVVVASIQVDLADDVLARFQQDLLERVHETGSRAVILDVSGLETLDSYEFGALRRIIVAVRIMGSESVLVGLRPGVVSALIEMGADVEGLQTAIDLDAAFELLEPESSESQQSESAESADPEGERDLDSQADPEGGAATLDAFEESSLSESLRFFEDER
jgi:rsbT antagonist protein RsbS